MTGRQRDVLWIVLTAFSLGVWLAAATATGDAVAGAGAGVSLLILVGLLVLSWEDLR